MSRIISEDFYYSGVRSTVAAEDGKWYAVDTAYTEDRGPELMVFRYNRKAQEITNWRDLYVDHFDSMDEALEAHHKVCASLEDYLVPSKQHERGCSFA